MAQLHIQVGEVLLDIEKEMRELRLWQAEMPSAEALASQQPFCIDTLTFPQWLQFVFLPRMHSMIEQRLPLPDACGIAPIAEEYFRELQLNSKALIAHLIRVDQVLTSAAPSSDGQGC